MEKNLENKTSKLDLKRFFEKIFTTKRLMEKPAKIEGHSIVLYQLNICNWTEYVSCVENNETKKKSWKTYIKDPTEATRVYEKRT